MELESSFSSTSSWRGEYLKECCKPTYQGKWLKNKAAILILTWSFLAMSVVIYYNISTKRDSVRNLDRPRHSELIIMGSLLLVGGWLADAHFGRYRVIICGIWVMWIGSLLSAFSLVLGKLNDAYRKEGDMYVSLFSKFVMGFGFGLFQSNIIQFGVDQLSEASSTEITSFITSYILTFFASSTTLYYSAMCTPDYVGVLVLTVSLSLALSAYFLFGQVLIKEQIVQNPLPLIWKIVHYAIKNHSLQQRFSSIEGGSWLSRLDIAKTLYNGPFRSEQVDDVKTFFRVLGVIASSTIAYTGLASVNSVKDRMLPHFLNWPNASTSVSDCYKAQSIKHVSSTFVVVVVLLHLIVIQPIFHKCIPKFNITSKFIIAVIFLFVSIIALLGIESASYHYQFGTIALNIDRCYILQNDHFVINMYFYWIIIPEMLSGLSLFMILVAAMEFVCAQVPFNMKGLVFGISYALFGLGTLIQTLISLPFLYIVKATVWEKAPLTCGIWYFIIQSLIILVCFVVMVVVIRKYKNRARINVIRSNWLESCD